MNKQYVKHHLIPQTYMRGWGTKIEVEAGEKRTMVYVYSKENGSVGELQNTNHLAYIDYFYSFLPGTWVNSKEDNEYLFKSLQSYIVQIDNIEVTDAEEYNRRFYDFDNWTVLTPDREVLKDTEKSNLKKQIMDEYLFEIENLWSEQHENDWNTVVKQLRHLSQVKPRKGYVNALSRNELLEFIATLLWRTEKIHPDFQFVFDFLTQAVDIYDILKHEEVHYEKSIYAFAKTAYDEAIHDFMLKYYRDFFKHNGPIFKELSLLINNYSIRLLKAPLNKEFITSDYPVLICNGQNGLREYFFPISPNIACQLAYGGSKDKYRVLQLTEEDMIQLNQRFKENCHKFYIQKSLDCSLYF